MAEGGDGTRDDNEDEKRWQRQKEVIGEVNWFAEGQHHSKNVLQVRSSVYGQRGYEELFFR